MNRRSVTKALVLLSIPGAVAATFALSACELIVDFDRTRIDAGQNADTGTQPPPDSSVPDTSTQQDTGAPDASDDAPADAPDDGG
jgi:hypothetical protein